MKIIFLFTMRTLHKNNNFESGMGLLSSHIVQVGVFDQRVNRCIWTWKVGVLRMILSFFSFSNEVFMCSVSLPMFQVSLNQNNQRGHGSVFTSLYIPSLVIPSARTLMKEGRV